MIVDGDFEDAESNTIKKYLCYISDSNQAGSEIAIAVPVGLKHAQEDWVVSFMMPLRRR
jgi:hypothetical protein